MPKRRLTIHEAPAGNLPKAAPRDAVALEFARKLQAEMIKHGWNQSDLAREATRHMPDGETINRDSISQYINSKNMPGPVRLAALASALKVDKEELMPSRAVTSRNLVPDMDMTDMGDGRMWLRVNQPVSWDAALEIAAILRREKAS